MVKLYLTRHGQTEWNLQARMQGHLDSPLTELGIQQAKQLRKALAETHIDKAYSSDKPRALNTAEIVLADRDISVKTSKGLREISLGDWDGMTRQQIQRQFPEHFHAFWKEPHLYEPITGESAHCMQKRVVKAVEKIVAENENKNILIVTHAGALKALMLHFESKQLSELWSEPHIFPASLSVVKCENGKRKIEKYGDTSHYKQEYTPTEFHK